MQTAERASAAPRQGIAARLRGLRGAPRELWVVYLIKVLEIAAYGLTTGTVILWLSSDLGYADAGAGDVYTFWSSLITIATLFAGTLSDTVGIKRTFLLGLSVLVATRLVLVASVEPWVVIPLGLLPSALGVALMAPVMTAAVKKYTEPAQRAMAFALYYALMNVAFALAGWTFDAFRGALGEYGGTTVLGVHLSTYRALLLAALAFTLPAWMLARFFVRDDAPAAEAGRSALQTVGATARQMGATFAAIWKQKTFYRFLGFLTLVVGVRLIFFHMQVTFPKFAIREMGEGAPIGQLWGMLNPVLIVVLVPLVGMLTGRISSYVMVVVGSAISAASVLILAVDPAVFTGLADGWLGDLIGRRWLGVQGAVSPWYVSIALFAVLLSVGEALWSPRLYEYTAAVAPKGQEASYMSLSLLPYFLAQFGVGMLSGRLLEAYVPEVGARDPATLWVIVAAMAAICPLGLLAFRRWLRVAEAGR